MRLFECPRCRCVFSTDLDDIQMHLTQKHEWPAYDAMVWAEEAVERKAQR